MPGSNRRQNVLRRQIRGGVARLEEQGGRRWIATENTRRVYTYFFDGANSRLVKPTVFEFDAQGIHLVRVWWSETGVWLPNPEKMVFANATVLEFGAGKFTTLKIAELPTEVERTEVFKPVLNDPNEMTAGELSTYIQLLKAQGGATPQLLTALERKRATLVGPLVMVLIGAPASLAFGKRSTVAALFLAVILGVVFWGVTGAFQHFGSEGYLPAPVSAWVPPFLFAVAGTYLLLRVKT